MFIIGSNTSETHPVIGAKMRQALLKGAKLIVVDPRKTEMASKAHVWLRLKPGTDIALLNGLMHIILQENWQDKDFIEQCTIDFPKVAQAVASYTPNRVAKITGVSIEDLYMAAKLYATAERATIFYTMGITEHICGTDNVMSLANLAMMTGNVGSLNSGVNPLRGQNNVQGACDVGALPNVYPGYQKVTDDKVRAKFEQAWSVPLSNKIGLTIPELMDAATAGRLKAMYVMGEDPVLSDADANHVKKALKSLDFLVVQDLFMTETAKLADVILPGASFAEKSGTFTNTERRVQLVRQAIPTVGGSRSDLDILIDLSNRLGYPMQYRNVQEIMEEIAALSPIYAGITYDRIEQRGLQWPVPHKDHPGTEYLHDEGKFSCGLGVFVPIEHRPPAEEPDEDYPLLLTTGRILYHSNVLTAQFSKNLTDFRPEEYAMINPINATALQIQPGSEIEVISRRGQVRCKANVTDKVPPGVIWLSFHYASCATNELTNGAIDEVAKISEYKVCAVKVKPV